MSPNIVLIVVDDMGYRDLGCYGSTFYETPRIDAFSRDAVLFTDAYASSPVCSPTRASILTGKYPARVGVTQWIGGRAEGRLCDVPYYHGLPTTEFSLARALQQAGYATWHVGKWHLGEESMFPEQHGFDVNIGGSGLGWPHAGHFSPYRIPGISDGPAGEYLTDRVTDEAIDLIRSHDGSRPFFLNLWHYAVHTPTQAPADLVEKYERKAQRLGLSEERALVEGEHFPCLHKRSSRLQRRVIQSNPRYAAMMENLDHNVGRLLDCLSASGLAGNTLVWLTSDNGGLSTAESSPTCNHPLAEGKGFVYEGGTRVCQLLRMPGAATGARCSVPVTSTDIYPTCLAVAGLAPIPEQHVDGVSLAPLLTGSGGLERDALFWHYPHYSNQGGTPACSMRSGDHKLIEFFEDGRLELYDLSTDIGEQRNLAGSEPELTRRMHSRLCEWRSEIEALIPAPNPNYPGPSSLPEGVDAPEI